MRKEIDRRQYRSVAELIVALRNRNLMTQRELAQRTGIAQAQLNRYEKGTAEPSLQTLRRVLSPFGWAPTIGVEPTAAAVDELLGAAPDPLTCMGTDAVMAVQVAAAAAANGAAIVVGGEAAAVLQGVPVRTRDVVLHLLANDLPVLTQTAEAMHRGVIESRDSDDVWELWCGEVVADVRLTDVLPASRLVRLDFVPWLASYQAPVVDLETLVVSGALGPAAMALVARMG